MAGWKSTYISFVLTLFLGPSHGGILETATEQSVPSGSRIGSVAIQAHKQHVDFLLQRQIRVYSLNNISDTERTRYSITHGHSEFFERPSVTERGTLGTGRGDHLRNSVLALGQRVPSYL